MLPVLLRELQAEARQPFTYWLRVLGAAALLLVGAGFLLQEGLPIVGGGKLFGWLHRTLFFSIWLLVPLVTADCISREKREGTFGLLFLTRLTARGVVLAKGMAHGLRALTLCVAVLPVLTIPFLMGGVSWQEGFLSLTTNLSSFCWALGAGLLASSKTKVWLRSLLLALTLAFVIALALSVIIFFWAVCEYVTYAPGGRWKDVRLSWQEVFAAGVVLTVNLQDVWKQVVTTLPRAAHFSVLRSAALGSSVSLFGLFLILQMAARNVQRGWREESASPRLLWLQRTFCTPVLWRRLFRRWMRRKLERNPIGWLEQRTWSARVVTWSWLAAMICLLSYGVAEINPYSGSGFTDIAVFMAWLLAGSMAMTAAGSFRRERETGVLELLLVSPLKVGQIIGGRLRGLWGQFLPAIVLLFGSWLYLANMRVGFGRSNADDEPLAMLFFAGAFFTLPVVGLYCSLRWNNFITAVVCTFGLGVLPFFLTALLSGLLEDYASGNSLSQGGRWQNFFGFHIEFSTVVAQVLIAGLLAFQLHQKLSTRSFVFEPG